MSPNQIPKKVFEKALSELGHNPSDYRGKKLSLKALIEIYGISQDEVLDAIDRKLICAHYDYQKDTIWVDALDAAHYYYCLVTDRDLSP